MSQNNSKKIETEILSFLISGLESLLGNKNKINIAEETKISDLELDTMDICEFILCIEMEYSILINNDYVFINEYKTVGEIKDYIVKCSDNLLISNKIDNIGGIDE